MGQAYKLLKLLKPYDNLPWKKTFNPITLPEKATEDNYIQEVNISKLANPSALVKLIKYHKQSVGQRYYFVLLAILRIFSVIQ